MYCLKLALRSIYHKKARTVFTSVSIAVGVASVLIISVISGLGREAMNNELDSLGINGLLISARDEEGHNSLMTDDLSLVREMDNISSAIPIVTSSGNVIANGRTQPIIIWGIDSGAEGIISFKLEGGSDISETNVANNDYCCLVDEKSGNNLGETIQVMLSDNKFNLKINGTVSVDSGIMKSLASDYIPPIIYIPYTTLQEMTDSEKLSQIAIKVAEKDMDNVDEVGKDIQRKLLLNRTESDTVSVQNLVQQRNKLNNLLNIITLALSAIGAVSLLVAGLSIMTVMMMSVNERTKEIGIKRAIGAAKGKVMTELLAETVLITLIGSIIGLVITFIVTLIGSNLGFNIKINISMIIITVVAAVAGGMLFGLYPSFIAAKLNPIDALRKD